MPMSDQFKESPPAMTVEAPGGAAKQQVLGSPANLLVAGRTHSVLTMAGLGLAVASRNSTVPQAA